MNLRMLFSWTLALLALPLAAAEPPVPPEMAQPELPRGQLIEKVTSQEAPDQTYALYLPSAYRPDRSWPILYALEARGQAVDFARRFVDAAEELGVIVASSYNTASDGPMQPNLTAFRAVWADTHRRLSIDDKRIYAAGFSGTVRAACLLAALSPGSIAGVIGASGGFPFDRPPTRDTPFVFFGTVGDRDFNFYEMTDLEADLAKVGLAHRLDLFEGGHEWPPAELAGEGLAWLELQSAKAGRRVKDPELLDLVWRQSMERARAYEAGGRWVDAFRTYQALAADFRGFPPRPELTELRTKLADLEKSEALAAARRSADERRRRDMDYLRRAQRTLAQVGGGITKSRLLTELEIESLKARAKGADREESLSAKRLLGTLQVQTGFYLPNLLRSRGAADRAALVLTVATEIDPENAATWYNLACAQAVAGWEKKAVESLRKAVSAGWSDLPHLEKDPDLDRLRKDKEFQAVVEEMKRKGAGAKVAAPTTTATQPRG